jgi:GTP-binding protein
LRHIEKFNLLFLSCDTPDIKGEYDILVNELTKYKCLIKASVVISKCDMLDDELKLS